METFYEKGKAIAAYGSSVFIGINYMFEKRRDNRSDRWIYGEYYTHNINPTNIANISCDGSSDCFVSGNYLYVAGWNDGFSIYDISSLSSPVLIASNKNYGNCSGVIVSGNYAFFGVGNIKDVVAFDVTDKANPIPIWTNSYGYYAIEMDGDYLYSMAGDNITIMDISIPTVTNTVTNISVNYVCFGEINNGKLAVGDDEYFNLYDVSSPSTGISELGSINFGQAVYGGASTGTTAFCGAVDGGIYTINTSTLETNRIYEITPDQAYEMEIYDDYLLITSYHSFTILNISNPASPTLMYTTTLIFGWGMYVSGNYAYVCDYGADEVKVIQLY